MATALQQAVMALGPTVHRSQRQIQPAGQYRRASRRALAAQNGWQYDLHDPAQQEQYKAYGLLPNAPAAASITEKSPASDAGRALANLRHHGDPAGPQQASVDPVAAAIMSGNPGALAALARALQQQG